MTEEHHIEWVELASGRTFYIRDLRPGEKPEVTFNVEDGRVDKVRAYCNLHGLWSA